MSNLSDLVGAPNADVLPGYTISRRDLNQIAAIESYFESLHRKSADSEDVEMTTRQRRAAIQQADAAIASGLFSCGSPFFTARINATTSLPYLLLANLRVTKSDITRAQVMSLLEKQTEGKWDKHPNFWKIRKAILEAWGYSFDGDDEKNLATQLNGSDQSTGETSTSSVVENADSLLSNSAA